MIEDSFQTVSTAIKSSAAINSLSSSPEADFKQQQDCQQLASQQPRVYLQENSAFQTTALAGMTLAAEDEDFT